MNAFFSTLLFGTVRFFVATYYGNQIRDWIRLAEGSGRPGEEKKEMVLKRIRIYLTAVGLKSLWDWNLEFWTNLVETEFTALTETGELSPIPMMGKYADTQALGKVIEEGLKRPDIIAYKKACVAKPRSALLKELEMLCQQPWSVERTIRIMTILGILR